MPANSISSHTLDNGLVLLVEEMPDVQSAAFGFLVPAGTIYQDEARNGTSPALCDVMMRGAGGRDSREIAGVLDFLGVQRDEQVGWNFMSFSGATLSDLIDPSLEIYADILLRPTLDEAEMEPVLAGIEQDLTGIEDDPQRKVLIELRRRCYDSPWNRPTDGDPEDLPNIGIDQVRSLYARGFRPNGTILGVAGNVKADKIRRTVDRLFGGWVPRPVPQIERKPVTSRYTHISHESSQTHIGIACEGLAYNAPDYYAAWAAVSVLSGGSSSRLFTEVRENRGLCYSIYATLHSLLSEGRILAYAGTTAERAQETLDVTLSEMTRLVQGIAPDELNRCKTRAKASLIMQQESTMSRASSLGRDWFYLGRVQTLDEIRRRIDDLTVETLLDYLHRRPLQDFMILTVGPEPLKVS
jgi:predicted Zn-dependent peptidase